MLGKEQVKMPGRNLKHFEAYKDKLLCFAEASGIKVIYRDNESDGHYSQTRSEIIIDPNLSDSHELAVLLHELGHCLDDTIVAGKKYSNSLMNAYGNVYDGKETKRQKQLVLECEKRAWAIGRSLAKRLKIRLGKWYDESQNECLADYRWG